MANNDSFGRVRCLIGGCGRTTKEKYSGMEWICQKHWSAVPKKYRKLYSLAKRKFKRMEINNERLIVIWGKCKDQAFINAWPA